jgi:hypothetical protein
MSTGYWLPVHVNLRFCFTLCYKWFGDDAFTEIEMYSQSLSANCRVLYHSVYLFGNDETQYSSSYEAACKGVKPSHARDDLARDLARNIVSTAVRE